MNVYCWAKGDSQVSFIEEGGKSGMNPMPTDALQRKAPPDLTVWLRIGGPILMLAGAAVLLLKFKIDPSFVLDDWRWRLAPLLLALGILVAFSVYGLLVAFRPEYVAIGARSIAQRVAHPRRFGLAVAWSGVLAIPLLALAFHPEAFGFLPGTLAFAVTQFVILAAGVVGIIPLVALQVFDRRRASNLSDV
jgi:hypothetical protein